MKQEAKPPLGGGNFSVGVPEEGLEPSNPCECRILSPMKMGEEGLEPSIPCGNKILSLASIPISPFALDVAVTNVFIFNPLELQYTQHL